MRVLVADKSALYRHILSIWLAKWDYDVVLARNGEEARIILQQENCPRLAILDSTMLGLGGFQLCRLIRRDRRRYIYAILLGATGEATDFVRGFICGADDYLPKPLDSAHLTDLRVRLSVGERIVKAHQHLLEAKEELHFQATHDPLTRLLNRRAVLERLNNELSRTQRLNTTFSVCLCDIDSFKNINDTYGHVFGDEVLRACASRLASCLREYDSMGRYGGDEFLVILPSCEAPSAARLAERLRLAIVSDPIRYDSLTLQVSVSIGICEWRKTLGTTLLNEADKALYQAKSEGRNCVRVALPAESPPAPER